MSASELDFLHADILKELTVVQHSLEKKYEHYVPVLNRDQASVVLENLEQIREGLDSRLDSCEQDLGERDIRSAIDEHKRLRILLDKLRACRELIDKFADIERTILELENVIDKSVGQAAELVSEASSSLPGSGEVKDGAPEHADVALSRICTLLSRRIDDDANIVISLLTEDFKRMFVFPPIRVPNVTQMNIFCFKEHEKFSEMFQAMKKLNVLGTWLRKVSAFLVDSVVGPIIACGGSAMVDCSIDNVNKAVHIFRVKSRKIIKSSTEINPEAVFQQLLMVFQHMHTALGGILINSTTRLSTFIMNDLKNDLMMVILKKVMCPMVGDDARFTDCLKHAEQFRESLTQLELINESTSSFEAFAAEHDTVFTDRKCIEFLRRARDLIQMEYTDVVTVGEGEEVSDETIAEFEEDIRKLMGASARDIFSREDASQPTFFTLLRCKVTRSTVDLVSLIQETVMEAAKSGTEAMAQRLMLTARNIVRLFLTIAPKHHMEALRSVPQIAALYYNNCIYISHRLLMLIFDVAATNMKQLDGMRIMLADFVENLRQSGQDAMEVQLVQIRREISHQMRDSSIFFEGNSSRDVDACLAMIQKCAASWKDVLTELVFCRAMGRVIGFMLSELTRLLLQIEDITTNNAAHASKLMRNTLAPLEKMVMIRGTPMLHTECAKDYFHYKEMMFLLDASLQDIDDRWCDGKGPLAEYVPAAEVHHIIKAIFANSELRKRLITKIY